MAKKILLADDSITIQKVVELTFSEGDYEVICVGNGLVAVRKIEEVVPDIALVDVMMPQRNGYEVCAHIKQDPNTSWIPVLLLTGTFEPFDPRRAEQVGANGHITKPFESRALVAHVEDLLAKHPRPRPVDAEPPPERPAIVPSVAPAVTEVVNAGQIFAAPAPPSPHQETSSSATVRIDSRSFFAQVSARGGDVLDAPPSPHETPSLGQLDMTAEAAELEPTHPLRAQKAPAPPPQARETPSPAAPALPAAAAAPASSVPAPSADEVARALERKIEEIALPLVKEAIERVVREVAWEVLPEVAEALVKRRIHELEEEAAGPDAATAH